MIPVFVMFCPTVVMARAIKSIEEKVEPWYFTSAPLQKAGAGLTGNRGPNESPDTTKRSRGAVAQLGERMTGSHEAEGSIPFSSTNFFKHLYRSPIR